MDKELASERRLAFGEELRKARESRGISLEGLAHETRIRLDFVQALESGEFHKLPGEVFGRGFVRSIGRTLGTDTDGLIGLFDAAWGPAQVPQSFLKVEIKNKPTRDHGDRIKVKWANILSILRRGLGFHTILPISMVILTLGLTSYGLWRGGKFLYLQVKETASEGPRKKKQELDLGAANQPRELASNSSGEKGGLKDGKDSPGVTTNEGVSASAPKVSLEETGNQGVTASLATTEISTIGPHVSQPSSGLAVVKQADGTGEIVSQERGGQQVIELVVTEPVRIKLEADQQAPVSKELSPDTYRFRFGSKAELMVYDAAALKVLFNGKSLGSLGSKGRIRRLSFQADALKPEKKM